MAMTGDLMAIFWDYLNPNPPGELRDMAKRGLVPDAPPAAVEAYEKFQKICARVAALGAY